MHAVNAEFLIIDLASDHQIEHGLATEGHIIATLLHERGKSDVTRFELVASRDGFLKLSHQRHSAARIIHLSAHANVDGLGAMGHDIEWEDVRSVLRDIVPPLAKDQKRILILSCCHSRSVLRSIKSHLRSRFSAAYFFKQDIVHFDLAIVTWVMFYGKRKLNRPAGRIKDRINTFLQRERLGFRHLR
jgi:hypothetical protein